MNETRSRLERARFQYESLLLHSGNSLLLSTTPPRSATTSPESGKHLASKRVSPINNSEYTVDGSYPSTLDINRSLTYDQADLRRPVVSETEKDEIILGLQEENERLREKLQFAIDSAEQVISDAQLTNDELVEAYEHKIKQLEESNRRLQEENQQLKVSYELAIAERDVERDQMTKSLKIIDQFKRRSKEYLEIQKKTHKILSNPNGFHFAIYATNPQSEKAEKE